MISMAHNAKTALLGLAPFCLFAAFAPAGRAVADPGSIFTALLGTITGPLGGSLSEIQASESTLHDVVQTVAFPVELINSAHGFISSSMARNMPYMNQVARLHILSATLPTTQSFEKTLSSGGTASRSAFYSTFGGGLSNSSQQPASVRLQQNMSDAASLDAIDLAGRASLSSSSTIALAGSLQTSASTVSPGDADMLTAQSNASLLASIAIEHQLLAAQLRIEASELAEQSLKSKRQIAAAASTALTMDKQGGN